MVILTPRFALLSVLASLAAFSLAPPADAAAVVVRGKSSHSSSGLYSDTPSAHGASATDTTKAESDPVIPLPSRLATQATSSSSKKSKTSKKTKSKSAEAQKRFASWNVPNARRSRARDTLPPLLSTHVVRPKPSVVIDGLNDHVTFGHSSERRHHHHHKGEKVDEIVVKGNNDNIKVGRSPEPHSHHHHGDDKEKVVVKGNDDNVKVGRSPESRSHHEQHGDKGGSKENNRNVHAGRSPEPHDHHDHKHGEHVDKVIVKGNDDNVKVGRSPEPRSHHHQHGDDLDKIIVKGNDDNIKVARSPEPHSRHHQHGGDKVIVKGNDDNVKVGRSPESRSHHEQHEDKVGSKGNHKNVHAGRSPEPHSHHHQHGDNVDKVIVKGNDDNVKVGRSPEPRSHHHQLGDDTGKVILKGNNDNIYAGRSHVPRSHHHHGDDKVVVKGNDDNVHLGRSPEVDSHHSDHDGEKIIKGNNGDVRLSGKRDVVINDLEGKESYVVAHTRRGHGHQSQKAVVIKGNNIDTHVPRRLKRDGVVMDGVPGTIDIISPLVNEAAGTRIASLVLASSDESVAAGAASNANWIMNASEKNFTQVYLVPVPVNSTAISTIATVMEAGDIPVTLKLSVFNPNSGVIVPYCLTFDPNPPAPAPLTAEPCQSSSSVAGQSLSPHKSQIFSYTSVSNALRPMWFNGEDDGMGLDSEVGTAPQDPYTPEAAGAASITSVDDTELSAGDFGNSTAPASIADLGNSTSDVTPQDDSQPRPQNVTMRFTPVSPELPAELYDSDDDTGAVGPTTPLSSNFTEASPATSGGVLNSTDDSTLLTASPGSTPTASSGYTQSTEAVAEELQVMVGIASDGEASGTVESAESLMTPVSTTPYKWRFRRDST